MKSEKEPLPREEQAKSVYEGSSAEYPRGDSPPVLWAELQIPHAVRDACDAKQKKNQRLEWWKLGIEILAFGAVAVYAVITYYMWQEMVGATGAAKDSAEQARRAVNNAERSLVLSARPWISVTHSVAEPLTFDGDGKVRLVLNETLENIGQSVALDVRSWVDVIPIDPEPEKYWYSALARLKEYGDANRPRETSGLPGGMLFPEQKQLGQMVMGVRKERVAQVLSLTKPMSDGQKKIGFFVVGCVSYRTSFEGPDALRHQTRVMYDLAEIMPAGGFRPYIDPVGSHPELQLFYADEGNSAD